MAKQLISFGLIVFILNCTWRFQMLYELSCSLDCFPGNLGSGALRVLLIECPQYQLEPGVLEGTSLFLLLLQFLQNSSLLTNSLRSFIPIYNNHGHLAI